MSKYEYERCRKNWLKDRHFYDCDCLKCETNRAFCTCSVCITRRTRFSGKFVDDRDFSRYPTMQQLVDLNEV